MLDFLKNYLGNQGDPATSGLRQSVLNNFYNSNLANNVDNPMTPFPQPFAAQYGQTGQLGAGLRNALFLSHLQKGQQQQSMLEQQRQQAAQTPVRGEEPPSKNNFYAGSDLARQIAAAFPDWAGPSRTASMLGNQDSELQLLRNFGGLGSGILGSGYDTTHEHINGQQSNDLSRLLPQVQGFLSGYGG
jgi:hypothetical protein